MYHVLLADICEKGTNELTHLPATDSQLREWARPEYGVYKTPRRASYGPNPTASTCILPGSWSSKSLAHTDTTTSCRPECVSTCQLHMQAGRLNQASHQRQALFWTPSSSVTPDGIIMCMYYAPPTYNAMMYTIILPALFQCDSESPGQK